MGDPRVHKPSKPHVAPGWLARVETVSKKKTKSKEPIDTKGALGDKMTASNPVQQPKVTKSDQQDENDKTPAHSIKINTQGFVTIALAMLFVFVIAIFFHKTDTVIDLEIFPKMRIRIGQPDKD